MLHDYPDIAGRIKEKPLWYDSNGVPRYDPFTPRLCPNPQAKEVVLVRIACAHCRRTFLVEMHYSDAFADPEERTCEELVVEGSIPCYGDPPRHNNGDHRCAGETMACDNIRILEFWQKDRNYEWVRKPKLEIEAEENYDMV
jgi:hypothetical protein